MKRIIIAFVTITGISSCKVQDKQIADIGFIDSLLINYHSSALQKLNNQNLIFWKNRIDSNTVSYVEKQQYAGALSARFHLYGDIHDLRSADSIMHWLNQQFQEKDAGPIRTLAAYALLQHRFLEAAEYVQKALSIGSDRYASELLNFDAAFELGQDRRSKEILTRIQSSNEYGYFFRLSKYEHLIGEIDSSISAMTKAADLAGNSISIKQTAISNTADLYMHAANPLKANELYMKSIMLDAADLHSLMGIGWIALVHDKKDTLAERIFRFVQTKTKSPEVILKMAMVAEQRGDSISEKKYATEFIRIVSDTIYGNMYNKYLIDLYSNFLNEPAKAVMIAERELKNRKTAQTYSWYVWSLFKNGNHEKALEFYNEQVSGKPLEGLELYYMGKFMQAMNKGYNAEQYFNVAYKSRYDLSPLKAKELETIINQ